MHLISLKEQASLAKYLRVMYIAWPSFARISINGVAVENTENPFNLVPLDSFVNYQSDSFALKTTKVTLEGQYTGIFIYKLNRLVRVLKVMSSVQMGKRTFKEANEEMSGIATLFKNDDLTLAKSDFQDKTIIRELKRIVQ